jgi:hypothetical protein
MLQRLYRIHASRLITPAEITAATLKAIERERGSVRLPRRVSGGSYLADAPRQLTHLLSRDLRRKTREAAR